jgi:hypothetical protein
LLIAVEHFVIQATVPVGVAVFTCTCGAARLEYDLKRSAPEAWAVLEDGSHLCPHCAGSKPEKEAATPQQAPGSRRA